MAKGKPRLYIYDNVSNCHKGRMRVKRFTGTSLGQGKEERLSKETERGTIIGRECNGRQGRKRGSELAEKIIEIGGVAGTRVKRRR